MAACGSSKEPGTQCVSIRSPGTPPASSAAAAPSASFFEMASLNRAATTANRPLGGSSKPCPDRFFRGAAPAISIRQGGEEVTHLLALGHEVALVALGGRNLDRHALDDLEAVPLDAHDLLRVVREDAQALRAEVDQDLRADAVVSQIGLEAQGVIGFDRVLAVVLQLVRAKLVQEPDPPPFLTHV